MISVGDLLKKFRINMHDDVTLTTLSKYTGLSQPYLSMIETGKKNPTVDTFFKIIEALSLFGENLLLEPFSGNEDANENRLLWIENMLDEFLEEFGYQDDSKIWVASKKLNENENAIFEAAANYRKRERQEYPSEYFKQLKDSFSNEHEVGNLNSLITFIPYSLDLKLLYDKNSIKNLKLSLDDIPISEADLDFIKNTLDGIRFNRK